MSTWLADLSEMMLCSERGGGGFSITHLSHMMYCRQASRQQQGPAERLTSLMKATTPTWPSQRAQTPSPQYNSQSASLLTGAPISGAKLAGCSQTSQLMCVFTNNTRTVFFQQATDQPSFAVFMIDVSKTICSLVCSFPPPTFVDPRIRQREVYTTMNHSCQKTAIFHPENQSINSV